MDIHVAGLSRWVPVDLNADPADLAQTLERDHPDTAAIELVAAGVAGLARTVSERYGGAGRYILALWVFSLDDVRLEPVAHATLVRESLPAGADAGAVLSELTHGADLLGPVDNAPLQTASGEALACTFRVVHHVEGERDVHQHACVIWTRPEAGETYVLSGVAADLVEGHELPAALHQLATGVEGL